MVSWEYQTLALGYRTCIISEENENNTVQLYHVLAVGDSSRCWTVRHQDACLTVYYLRPERNNKRCSVGAFNATRNSTEKKTFFAQQIICNFFTTSLGCCLYRLIVLCMMTSENFWKRLSNHDQSHEHRITDCSTAFLRNNTSTVCSEQTRRI